MVLAAPAPLAYAALLACGVLWGSTFSLQKLVMESPLAHPLGVSLWQAIIGSCVGFALAALGGHLPRFDREHLRFFVMLGFIGTAVPNTLFYAVAEHLPAGVLAISVTTVPLLTYIAAMLMRVEAFEIVRVAGLVLGFVAIALVLVPQSALPERGQALWLLPALLSAMCYAAEAMLVTFKRPAGTHSLVLVAGGMLMTVLMLTPVVLLTNSFFAIALPLDSAELSLFAMTVVSILAYAMYLFIVRLAGPVFASQVGYVVTLAGVGWGMLVFGERHSFWVWGAIGLLMAGVTLVRPTQSSTAPAPADQNGRG